MTQPADIVERLERKAAIILHKRGWSEVSATLKDAAAEITRLRAELAEAHTRGVKAGLDAAARVADRRAEDRFAEYGTTEPDTNASYYSGRRAEALDELDEEDWAIRDAIRAIDPASVATPDA